jgi:ABC-type Na+ efflux pump permease subunit
MAVAPTVIFIIAVLYSATKESKADNEGLTGFAVSPQVLFVTAVFFVLGSGLMYWHLH